MDIESSFTKIIMGMVVMLFLVVGVVLIINNVQNNSAYDKTDIRISGLNNLTNDIEDTQESLKQITGEESEAGFLTTMKNVITGKVLSLKDVYKIYRSFISNMLISLGLDVDSQIILIINIAITIFVLLVILMLILKIFI